ncbi:hypothetical protein A3770_05p37130 [Chloropicon primus]|uniref:Rab-GAP TBC domain-containing protein n=1 Tax=Chloropicon primus TaxID=1764295 RepID=A0A5B8MNQ4_9CHLO|nr:hypothetical protein A3770_05p37130 [Chloropicon primus]|eukprot:QDZ21195.1 hypothetical protein A3770_05p37130 [Chloropicon primus]
MSKNVTVDEKEFYASRMSLLDNFEGSDKKEMYRDINDLREEIVKILHEFGSSDKSQLEGFAINESLTAHATRKASRKKVEVKPKVVVERSKSAEEEEEGGGVAEAEESGAGGQQPFELHGLKQQHSALGRLSHEWASGLCERLKSVASRTRVPLAANGYDFYRHLANGGTSSSGEFKLRSKDLSSDYVEYQHDQDGFCLYSVDTLFEAVQKLKVLVDRNHRDASPSLFNSREVFRQVEGSKSYYSLEMRDLIEYGCSLIPKCLPLMSCADVYHEYSDLDVHHAQIGVDDLVQDPYYTKKREAGVQLLEKGDVSSLRKFCRTGVPSEMRCKVWAASLGVKIDVVSNPKKKWLASLHRKRKMSKMLIERMVERDISTILDSDHYFPFEDILKSTLLAFLLDEKVLGLCKGEAGSRPKLYGFGESGENHGLYPPCGVIPFRGMSWYAAPLTFLFGFQELSTAREKTAFPARANHLQDRYSQRPFSASHGLRGKHASLSKDRRKSETVLQKSQEKQRKELSSNAKQIEDHAGCYFFFRALYCRYFCKLHSGPYDPTSGSSPSLLGLCQLFECLMEETEPEVNYHLYGIIGVSPLALAFPWIVQAFADILVPEQVLLLWDRVVGFDSLIPLVLLAVSIFHYRKRELLQCESMEEINFFLQNFRDILVVPLLQKYVQYLGKQTGG